METKKFLCLDSVRGIAALCVIFSHSFLWFAPYLHTGVNPPSDFSVFIFNSPITFFFKGSSAVMLFFILSGFVLTRACVSSRNKFEYISSAIIKRYFRLNIPVAASIFICFTLSSLGLFTADKLGVTAYLSSHYTANVSFNEAIYDAVFGGIISGSPKFNYVLWTINIEFFGSLLIFAINGMCHKNVKLLRNFSLIAVIACFLFGSEREAYYGLFFMGSALAATNIYAAPSFISRKYFSIAIIFSSLYLLGYNEYTQWSYSYKWLFRAAHSLLSRLSVDVPVHVFLPSLGAFLLIYAIIRNESLASKLESKFLSFFGKLSFSLYLLHTFLLALVAPIINITLGGGIMPGLICAFAVIALTTMFSVPFYAYVDKRSISIANKMPMIFSKLVMQRIIRRRA